VNGGGRRPRSVCAVKLKHVVGTVTYAFVRGEKVLVPSFTVTFVDEKFSDVMGHRSTKEWLTGVEEYETLAERSFSYWFYKELVIRDAFEVYDPMKNGGLAQGDVLEFKQDSKEWFLFCCLRQDVFVNTKPCTVGVISRATAEVLEAMGSEPRGYSAHRKGCPTRVLMRELVMNGGISISDCVKRALVRWGGWDVKRGMDTLDERYVQFCLDTCLDVLGLGTGRKMSMREKNAKLAELNGDDVRAPVILLPPGWHPLIVRMMAYQEVNFGRKQKELDERAKVVYAIGLGASKNIWQIHRKPSGDDQ